MQSYEKKEEKDSYEKNIIKELKALFALSKVLRKEVQELKEKVHSLKHQEDSLEKTIVDLLATIRNGKLSENPPNDRKFFPFPPYSIARISDYRNEQINKSLANKIQDEEEKIKYLKDEKKKLEKEVKNLESQVNKKTKDVINLYEQAKDKLNQK